MKSLNILFEDSHCLVVEKFSGLHTLGPNESMQSLLISQIPAQGELPDSGICHRLDQLTSGALFVAKSLTDFEVFRSRFSKDDGGFKKSYLALVETSSTEESGEFDFYFRGRYKSSKKISVYDSGKEVERGRCRWSRRQLRDGLALLEVELLGPGRRHQIRAGLSYLKMPIAGDLLYGAKSVPFFGLHAWKLEWDQNSVICPPPVPWPLQI